MATETKPRTAQAAAATRRPATPPVAKPAGKGSAGPAHRIALLKRLADHAVSRAAATKALAGMSAAGRDAGPGDQPDKVIVPKDHPTIQEAINAVAPGGTVLIEPGTYPESLSIADAVRLKAADPTVRPVITSFAEDATISISTLAKDVTLDSLEIRNSLAEYIEQAVVVSVDTDLRVRNCQVAAMLEPGGLEMGISITGGSIRLTESRVEAYVFAAALYETEDSRIKDSHLVGGYGAAYLAGDKKTVLAGNTLLGLNACWAPNIVQCIGSESFSIKGNSFGTPDQPIAHLGVYAEPLNEGSPVADGRIADNIFYGDTTDYTQECGYWPAPPLMTAMNGTKDIRITKNKVKSSYAAFWFFDWFGPQDDIVIKNNDVEIVEQGDSAILCFDVHNSRVSGNDIRSAAWANTVAMIDCTNNRIRKNTLTGENAGAFYLAGVSEWNRLSMNDCEDTTIKWADCYLGPDCRDNDVIEDEFGDLQVTDDALAGIWCEGRKNRFRCNEFGDGYEGWDTGVGWYYFGETSRDNSLSLGRDEEIPEDQILDKSGDQNDLPFSPEEDEPQIRAARLARARAATLDLADMEDGRRRMEKRWSETSKLIKACHERGFAARVA